MYHKIGNIYIVVAKPGYWVIAKVTAGYRHKKKMKPGSNPKFLNPEMQLTKL